MRLRKLHEPNRRPDRGYAMLGTLVFVALSALIAAGMLSSTGSHAKTRAVVRTQAEYYYEVEETLNRVVGWLQSNSKNLVTGFTAANFNNNFDLGAPALGSNEGQHFGVPTLVKMKNTNNSVMLSNNDFFGAPAFPSTSNIETGTPFDAISAFQNADLGEANARVILVWARETDGNYEPVFRVDVVTGNNPDRGVHSFSYVYSTLVTGDGAMGFYGRDALSLSTPNNDCYSYRYTWTGSAWSRGAPRSNCPVASDEEIAIKAKVNGTAKTLLNNGITFLPPGGSVSGETCDGAGCHGYVLPTFSNWSAYCPGANSAAYDRNISNDTTLPAGCYRDITIANKKKLLVTDNTAPYYIRSLNFQGAQANFDPGIQTPGNDVEIFVENIANDHLNGNRVTNPGSAPHQLRINYIGTAPLTLNGTAGLSAVITAPNVKVTTSGNFSFYGGVFAQEFEAIGNAKINYDEALGGNPVLNDMRFALKKTSQRYR